METRDQILQVCNQAFGREMVDEMIALIGDDPEKFKVLIDLATDSDQDLSRRAGWPLNYIVEENPPLILPYLGQVLSALKQASHNGVKRNFVRALSFVEIPEDYQGEFADLCFTYLNDPTEAIAVRVFSMDILFRICQSFPELAPELALVLREHIPQGSAGFKNRGKKILKRLEKLQN